MDKLKYNKPATKYGLPLGNGYMGVMAYGGRKGERLAFNHCTLWAGTPEQELDKQDYHTLKTIRDLVFAGENYQADKLAEQALSHSYSASFLPLCDIVIKLSSPAYSGFSRSLDIKKAIYQVCDKHIEREAFVSYPDNVAVYRMQCKQKTDITVKLASKLQSAFSYDGGLNIYGNAPDYCAPSYKKETHPVRYDAGKGMGFCLRAEYDTDGKTVSEDYSVSIIGATNLTLYIVANTGFLGNQNIPDSDPKTAKSKCVLALNAINKDYQALKERHIQDYQKLYSFQQLRLFDSCNVTTDKLVRKNKKGTVSPSFIELAFNFAKYLLISGSRHGCQALNLQGIWNEKLRPPWSSNYTVNINTQMNYWPATAMGLQECVLPFIDLVYELSQLGQQTASLLYNCGGFACNHNTDLWRKTTPAIGHPMFMFAPLCGVWLANEVYTHYKNGDFNKEYTQKVQAIVKGAATFCNDFLVRYKGKWVICPSVSPENSFVKNKQSCSLDYASAYDMGLVKQAFANYLELFAGGDIATEITAKQSELYPFGYSANGLWEWHKEYKEKEPGHRHFSPLYAFYPGNIIDYYNNPLKEQVAKLFDTRLANLRRHIGWSGGWAACISAKLRRQDQVKEILSQTVKHCFFPNLLGVHPPGLFQIDGNFGLSQAVINAIVLCENDIFELLPACPWDKGEVSNLKICGVLLSFKWKNGKVIELQTNKKIKIMQKNLAKDCIIDAKEVTIIQ